MREKGSQRANVKGSLEQGRNCCAERVSKDDRESRREQWYLLLPLASRESVCCGRGGMHVLQDGTLHRDMGPREEVGERRQEEVWGTPEIERRQRDQQGAGCMLPDEQCLLSPDLWKQQSVQPTRCSREGKVSVCGSGVACHLPQIWARGRGRRGFSGESDLIQVSPLFISLPPILYVYLCSQVLDRWSNIFILCMSG